MIDYLIWNKRKCFSDVVSLKLNKNYKYVRRLIDSIYIKNTDKGYELSFFNQKNLLETNKVNIIVTYVIYDWEIIRETINRLRNVKKSS